MSEQLGNNNPDLLSEIQKDYKNAKKKKREKPIYVKEEKKVSWKTKVKRFLGISLIVIIGVAYGAEKYAGWRAEHQWQSPLVWREPYTRIEKTTPESPVAVKDVEAVEIVQASATRSWIGKVSYYSHDGCLGCHPEQIMANGQKFDENAMTLAFNHLPLNTRVRVTNMDNGANTLATVTDTGGFEAYGRIADLSKGLMQELNATTDRSTIKIEVLE